MQDGDITDLELASNKSNADQSIKRSIDSARGQIEIYDQYKELNEHSTVEHLDITLAKCNEGRRAANGSQIELKQCISYVVRRTQ